MLRLRKVRVSPLVALAIALALATACGRDAPAPEPAASSPGGRASSADGADGAAVLKVCNWSDYIGKDTLRAFEATAGIRVDYCNYANNDALLARLKAAPGAYDVVFPTAHPYARDLVAEGALATLDKSLLPNLGHMDPAIMAELAEIDPGNAHLVPYMWGTTGLGVNVDQVRAALGPQAPLDSWGLLFDPANAARLSRCGIGIIESDTDAFPPALMWKGLDARDDSDRANDTVRAVYAAIRPHIRKIANGDELIKGLAEGQFCVVLTYSGDVSQARARADEQSVQRGRKPPEIRYVIPREGAVRWIDVMAIPEGAPSPAAAHRFVDYLMTPAVIASISDEVAYANANRDASALMASSITQDPGIYPPPAVQAKLVGAGTPDAARAEARRRAWDAIVYGSL